METKTTREIVEDSVRYLNATNIEFFGNVDSDEKWVRLKDLEV